MRHLLLGPFLAWARKLKFPALFKLVGALFVLTLLLPDPIPFIDEILLGLGTLLLASWKDRNKPAAVEPIEGQATRR
ncbi:hypothetical protein EBB59_00840 [Lysobacter pythonis]|uniref:Uncharacterized protein n=1 Tax=Solilutibacter pythonis TaxID=2483112 RepID=A0A3M2I464_9GAMM|nr:DUF6116 family protein [Lysobacter pythonis]RMH94873.1 hypothetical protein EBB59_00840 [Lysobacter pythonis]